MKLRYRYRFYPSPTQREQLVRTFGCVRYVYNWALTTKRQSYEQRRENISYAETDRRLTQLKRADATSWLAEVSSVPLKQALRHLENAYKAFFRGDARYPRPKRRKHRQTATYTRDAFVARGSGKPEIQLAKQNRPLRIRWSRPLPAEPSSLTVVLDADGRWYVSFVVEVESHALEKTNRAVGVDLGIRDLMVTSEGFKSDNPQYLRNSLERLALERRRLSRKRPGSANWHKQRRRVARVHSRVRDQRKDFLHKLTTRLIRDHDLICCESLTTKNMMGNRSVALSISDCGWATFLEMLRYKAHRYGKLVIELDRWCPSTKSCSRCGHVVESLPLNVRAWTCPSCATRHDRDVNAAANILAAGMAVAARGEAVRPEPTLVGRLASAKRESRA